MGSDGSNSRPSPHRELGVPVQQHFQVGLGKTALHDPPPQVTATDDFTLLPPVNDVTSLPKQVAWILATRRVFMYPELMPTCSLKAKTTRDKVFFTKGEDK